MEKKIKDSILDSIFLPPTYLKSVLIKKLPKNDNASKHGIVIPVEAYPMFPVPEDFDPDVNYTEDIAIITRNGYEVTRRESKFKYYQRYPERRITRLPDTIDSRTEGSLFVLGQTGDREYEIYLFEPETDEYKRLVKEFALQINEKIVSYVGLNLSPPGLRKFKNLEIAKGSSIERFLKRFDEVKANNPYKSLRAGDTGIGYTFETIMGVEENNFSGPDFEDIEIKCYTQRNMLTKKNLFLKEPEWSDGIKSMVERVKLYGYVDEEGRNALYSSVTINKSSHSFNFFVSRNEKKVYLQFDSKHVAFWSFQTLQDRLSEKLQKAMYVGTGKTKRGNSDYFEYKEVTFCSEPFIDSFINLIEIGQVILELRMHVTETDGIRNHGTGFRINEKYLPELYATIQKLRS